MSSRRNPSRKARPPHGESLRPVTRSLTRSFGNEDGLVNGLDNEQEVKRVAFYQAR